MTTTTTTTKVHSNDSLLLLHSTKSSTQSQQQQQNNPPSIEVILSRPTYRLGTSVVGNIRLLSSNTRNTNDATPTTTPRDCFVSAHVYVAGRCRVDSRWHNPSSISYYTIQQQQQIDEMEKQIITIENNNTTVTHCFWATPAVSLLDLQERTVGRWEDVKPTKPLILPPNDPKLYFVASSTNNNNNKDEEEDDETTTRDDAASKKQQQLSFTFRADLPLDIPHSAAETSCRYSYSVVVYAMTQSSTVRELLRTTLAAACFCVCLVQQHSTHTSIFPPLFYYSIVSLAVVECTLYCLDLASYHSSYSLPRGNYSRQQQTSAWQLLGHGTLLGLALSCLYRRDLHTSGTIVHSAKITSTQ